MQDVAEADEAAADVGFDGAQGEAEGFGDGVVGEAFEEGALDEAALLGGEGLQGFCEEGAVILGGGFVVGLGG